MTPRITPQRKSLLHTMSSGAAVTIAYLREKGHNLSCIRAALLYGYIKHATADCKTVQLSVKGRAAIAPYIQRRVINDDA